MSTRHIFTKDGPISLEEYLADAQDAPKPKTNGKPKLTAGQRSYQIMLAGLVKAAGFRELLDDTDADRDVFWTMIRKLAVTMGEADRDVWKPHYQKSSR